MARSLMVLGTGSSVGKSLLTAALCRIFVQDGWRVAPFKAQNMALNSAATPEGLEIGRAQAVQAEAAGLAPSADMNPILLKPEAECASQVVVQGRVLGRFTAADYTKRRAAELFPKVVESFERLSARHDLVILEGAGSPAEFNLKDSDIVNMRMAAAADAACLLVGDIDRGGVFASLLGTLALLGAAERRRIRGFAINRFRGDVELLRPALPTFERRIGIPCLGVIPWLDRPGLEEEDGVAHEERRTVERSWPDETGPQRRARVAVVALPHLANFTDFDALADEPSVALAFVDRPEPLGDADLVVLPGTKQTLDDLAWLERSGVGRAVSERARAGALTFGICGGLQMLGEQVADESGLEGGGRRAGLGLLPLETRLRADKVTLRARATSCDAALFGGLGEAPPLPRGYEIHLGETRRGPGLRPLFRLRRERGDQEVDDGACADDGRVAGSYLHGLFDDDDFRHALVAALRRSVGLAPAERWSWHGRDRERRFDRIADHVRASLDVAALRSWLEPPPPGRAPARRRPRPAPQAGPR